MAWPDRLGIGVALLMVIGMALWTSWVCAGAPLDVPRSDIWHLSMVYLLPAAELLGALPIWLVARILDFILGGHQRRRGH